VRLHAERAAVLGGGWGVTTAQWDALAQRRARVELGTDRLVDDNEAEAVCIGVWATRAAEVAKKIPKGRKARAA
jgi:hypothetical protein